MTYAKPTHRYKVPTVHPQPLAPLEEAPCSSVLYSLNNYNPLVPSPEVVPSPFIHGFSKTRHIIPAAFPRIYSPILPTEYPDAPPNESKEERKARTRLIGQRIVDKKRALERGDLDLRTTSPVLFLELDRFARTEERRGSEGGEEGLTLFLAHANGFHKEVSTVDRWAQFMILISRGRV